MLKIPRTRRVPANKGQKLPVEILTAEEVKALIRACSSRAPTGVRNRALLTLLYRGGLRLRETLALYPRDVDPVHGTLGVFHGRGHQRRIVGLDTGALAVLERWMDRRPRLGLNGRQPLFCTLQGQPLKSAYVRAMLPRLARRAGIEKRVHAQGLRHTHAAELAQERIPVNLISRQLGHSGAGIAARYLDPIAPEDVVEAVRRREWSL